MLNIKNQENNASCSHTFSVSMEIIQLVRSRIKNDDLFNHGAF